MTQWDAFWQTFFYWLSMLKGPLWFVIILLVVGSSWWLMMKKD